MVGLRLYWLAGSGSHPGHYYMLYGVNEINNRRAGYT